MTDVLARAEQMLTEHRAVVARLEQFIALYHEFSESQANASTGNAATAEDESQGDSGSGEASRLSGGSGPVASIQNADALRARPPAGAVNDATAPAPSRAEIIRGLHAEHPGWTAPDIARHLGIIPQKVVKAATRAGIVLPKGKPGRRKPETRPNGRPRQPESLLSRIRAHIADHPDASSVDCAAALGTTVEKVRNSIKGSGVVLAPAKRGPNSAAHPAPQPQDRAAAPAQPPAPSSPARTNVSSIATGRTSPSAIVTKPVHRPSGARFHLRDDAGRYLRFDCMDMTDDRARAWIGDERQLAGCRRAFSLAADLREVPVPKEERAA